MRISATGWRFIAYSFFGILLLIIYQIVFMARTSASRDWNHIHNSHFTLPELQRLALHSIDDAEIGRQTSITHNISIAEWPFRLRRSESPQSYKFVAKVTGPNGPIPVSEFSPIFAYPSEESPENNVISFRISRLLIIDHLVASIDHLVSRAAASNAEAIVLIVSTQWVPNIGLTSPKIPIIAVNGPLFRPRQLVKPDHTITVELATSAPAPTAEFRIDGFTSDTVIIGDSRGSSQSVALFLELTRVFKKLTALGWRPLRTIRFVSFTQFSAESWARQHESFLRKSGIAYLDCGPIPTSSGSDPKTRFGLFQEGYKASPLLIELSQWALAQLVDAGILNASLLNADPLESSPSLAFGADTFLFQYGVPSIGISLGDLGTSARFLALLATTLAQSPILPWSVSNYTRLLASEEHGCSQYADQLTTAGAEFDHNISTLAEVFTEEFPWYQFKAKFSALWQRKKANLIMRLFEQRLIQHGRHSVFESNPDHTGTRLRKPENCQSIETLLSKLKLP